MRIKAVLRDADILKMEAGTKERVLAAAKKNVDRFVNWPSLMKVMGLTFEDRLKMFEILSKSELHIWLLRDGEQHLIYLSEGKGSPEIDAAYQWQ